MILLLLLICWPLAELFVAVEVARAIGLPATLLLLVASWPIGFWILRTQGRAAWRRLGDAVAAGRSPGAAVLDGALILTGAVLLIVPGFITDLLGAMLLFFPTRALGRAIVRRNLQRSAVLRVTRFGRSEQSYDVDATATDVDPRDLRP